jgi:hypothetical protein
MKIQEEMKMLEEMNIQEEMKMIYEMQINGEIPNPLRFDTSGGMDFFIQSTNNFLISHSEILQNDFKEKFDYCYLRMIYVPIEKRKKGLGKLIINELINKCKLCKIFRIEVESEEESLNFFKKLGFEQIKNQVKNRLQYVIQDN